MSELDDALKDLPPDVAAQFKALADGTEAKASKSSPTKLSSAYDPSAGGDTLKIQPGAALGIPGTLDTHIPLSQGVNRFLAGSGQGLTDVVRKAGNFLGLQSNQDLEDAKSLDAPLLNTGAGMAGSFAGQMAASAPLGMGVGAGMTKLGGMAAAKSLPTLARIAANPIAQGVGAGAAQGALLADPGQKGQGALLGGALGGVLPGIGAGIGKMANGMTRTPAAQTLLDAGVSLTPAQMNPKGPLAHMAQMAEAIPGVGSMFQNANEQAMKGYSRTMVEGAMAPGAKLPAGGDFNQMLDHAAASFDPAYDAVHGFGVGAKIMKTNGPDIPLQKAFAQVAAQPRLGLDAATRQGLADQLNEQTKEMIAAAIKSGNGLQSEDLLGLRSMIRTAARDEAGDTAASRATRGFWKAAEDKVTQALESQIPTQAAKTLKATDAQFAKFAIIRDVGKSLKDAPGGPTPFQFSNAIANATDANTYARGGGLGRDLAKAARATFTQSLPRNGMLGAGAALGALGGKAAFAAAPVATGLAASPLAAMAGLTLTKTGRSLAAGNTGVQRAMQGGMQRLQSATPQALQSLLPQYGRTALVNAGLLKDQ